MIRIQESDGWLLVDHRDHARLAGQFASHWNNDDFAAPEPRRDVLISVTRHDDAWAERDAAPVLTREGRPSAFSHELVGTYAAFEEIDLEDYLRVRGRATETVAADNPYAAIIVSMHTVNLLTEQAKLNTLNPAQREILARFIAGQRERQDELAAVVASQPGRAGEIETTHLRKALEFLQACDSLSLIVCVNYPRALPLRHQHPRRNGAFATLTCTPVGAQTYRVRPWPFDQPELRCIVPARRVVGKAFGDLAAFRASFAAAAPAKLRISLVR